MIIAIKTNNGLKHILNFRAIDRLEKISDNLVRVYFCNGTIVDFPFDLQYFEFGTKL